MKEAGEERGTLKAERVGNLVDGKISVAQQHLCPKDTVGVEPVHYAAATLLSDNSRQMIGSYAEMVCVGFYIPRERVFPAKSIQKLLENALTPAEFCGAFNGLMGVQEL